MSEAPEIGIKYKNKSVAEQKSVDIAFTMLMKPEYKSLRHYIYTNEKQLMQFRQVCDHGTTSWRSSDSVSPCVSQSAFVADRKFGYSNR